MTAHLMSMLPHHHLQQREEGQETARPNHETRSKTATTSMRSMNMEFRPGLLSVDLSSFMEKARSIIEEADGSIPYHTWICFSE